MAPVRAVFDTNVIVSALVFPKGRVATSRALWRTGAVTPLVSAATATELLRTLAYPAFDLSVAEQRDLLADYLPACEVVHIPDPPPPVPECRDPNDRAFLHLAFAGKAQWLVTGDKDLLALRGAVPFEIVTPAEFAERIST